MWRGIFSVNSLAIGFVKQFQIAYHLAVFLGSLHPRSTKLCRVAQSGTRPGFQRVRNGLKMPCATTYRMDLTRGNNFRKPHVRFDEFVRFVDMLMQDFQTTFPQPDLE